MDEQAKGPTVEVKAEAWSGNVRPWRGVVLVNDERWAVTGACKRPGRAITAARALVGDALARYDAHEAKAVQP